MNARIQQMFPSLAAAAVLALALLLAAAPASGAQAPAGKTYFVVSIGLSTESPEAYEAGAGCIRFTPDEMCESDGACGSWWLTEDAARAPKQSPFAYRFEFTDDESGTPLEVDGSGRVDWRGKKSSIAGVGTAIDLASGVKINFAIAGRAVGPARCDRLVEEFDSEDQ